MDQWGFKCFKFQTLAFLVARKEKKGRAYRYEAFLLILVEFSYPSG